MANPPPSDENKKKIAADCFRKATEALLKKTYDYAVKMARTAVNLVPENVLYRQTLRGATEKMYGDNGSGAAMSGMRLMGTKASLKKSKMQKDWNAVIQTSEDGLATNPWDASLNADLGEALQEVGFSEAAQFCYERAVKFDPNNKDYLRALGRIYEERRKYDEAIGCFQKVMNIDKLDGEARQKVTHLAAMKTMDRGGYEDAENTHNVSQIKGQKSGEADGPGQSVEADLLRTIRKDPNNRDNYLKLADHYRRDNKLAEAEEFYTKALELSGGDVRVQETLEDVQLDRMRTAMEFAKDAALKNADNPKLKQKHQQLKTELRDKEIEVFAAREPRYPQDMRLKYELSLRYIKAGKHQLAIPLLQKARGDSRIKCDALLQLGKCFIVEKQYPLARRQFEQALTDIDRMGEEETYKELSYYAGRVCEELKDYPAAINHYQAVLEIDYAYKDNRERLQKLEEQNGSSTDSDA